MSFELISGEPSDVVDNEGLLHVSVAAQSVVEMAAIRGDTIDYDGGICDVWLDDAQSRRLVCKTKERLFGLGAGKIVVPREIWLVEDRLYADPIEIANVVECDMQFFEELRGSERMTPGQSRTAIDILKGIIDMQCRLARGNDKMVVRTMGYGILWKSGVPCQEGHIGYAPSEGRAEYFEATVSVDDLAVGEANSWLQRFNDYIHRVRE